MLQKQNMIFDNINNYWLSSEEKDQCLDSENGRECCICLRKINTDYALYPCGHTQFCKTCINFEKCPLCKIRVKDIIKLYF